MSESNLQSLLPIPELSSVAKRLNGPIADAPPDIIPGLLPRHGELVIAGETDIGKSLLALEIASSLMTGQPLWGELKPVETYKKILYVLGEHYVEVIQRLLAVTRLPMPDSGLILGPEQLGYDKWLISSGKVNVQAVSKFQKWAEGMDMIIWDPLASFITGGGEQENDNITMRLVLDTMSLIAQKAGATCLVLAHQGKPNIDKFGQEHTRTKYAIRGASGIEDAATNIFYMNRAEGHSNASNNSDSKILSLIKRKYKGTAPNEYKLVRNPQTLTHTIITGTRPFVEASKMETQAKYTRMVMAFPDMRKESIIKALAAVNNVSESTIWNHLKGGA